MRPTFVCRHCSSMCLMSVVTVVLPFVPVTPIMVSSRDGLSKNSQQMRESARRLSATRIYGISTSGRFWQSTTAAPRSTAAPINRCPSDSYPQTAANRSPGCVVRESKLISRMSSSGSAVHARTFRTDSSRLSFIKGTSVVRQYRPNMPESVVTSVTSTTVPCLSSVPAATACPEIFWEAVSVMELLVLIYRPSAAMRSRAVS